MSGESPTLLVGIDFFRPSLLRRSASDSESLPQDEPKFAYVIVQPFLLDGEVEVGPSETLRGTTLRKYTTWKASNLDYDGACRMLDQEVARRIDPNLDLGCITPVPFPPGTNLHFEVEIGASKTVR